MLANVVHLINGVDALFQDVLLDLFDVIVLKTLSYSRQLLEEISRKLVKRDGAVNLYYVRRLRSIQQLQSIRKIFDVDILFSDVFDTEVLLPNLYNSAVIPTVIINESVVL